MGRSCMACTLLLCLSGRTTAVRLAAITPVRSGTRATRIAMIDTHTLEEWIAMTNSVMTREVRACRDAFEIVTCVIHPRSVGRPAVRL
jgi:hypothetical protein